ncbi:MAG: hypothetical protein ACF8NJ_10915 [Phycisphaerales bacterium JB038]
MELIIPVLVVVPVFALWLVAARSANPKGKQAGAWLVGVVFAAIALVAFPVGWWGGGFSATDRCSHATIEFHKDVVAAVDEGKIEEVREVLASLDDQTWTYEYPLFVEYLEHASAKLREEE